MKFQASYGAACRSINKLLAVSLSMLLFCSSSNAVDAALAVQDAFGAPTLPPQFKLVPPPNLGQVSDYFNAPDAAQKKTPIVVLIQDLHVNYGVQKNIAGILDFLSAKLGSHSPTDIPFAV